MAGLAGCVDQHPEESRSADSTAAAENVRLIATSPAAADICDKLELDLVGVCKSSISTIPSRYDNATQVGMAMSPDVEIVKSIDLAGRLAAQICRHRCAVDISEPQIC